MDIVVCEGSRALKEKAADLFVGLAQDAIASRGRFTVALAGGSTPQDVYVLLAQMPRVHAIDWQKTFLFMSDERCVPYDDDRSNFGQARGHFVEKVPVPPGNVMPIPTDAGSPDYDAAEYVRTLAGFFGVDAGGDPPVFDLVLLGLGDDGHCASLFPGKPTLEETGKWVVSSGPGTLPPPVDRVTFTFPLINAARAVMFIVGGAVKAPAVQDILENDAPVTRRPAAGVRPLSGGLTWVLDTEAASLLSARTRGEGS